MKGPRSLWSKFKNLFGTRSDTAPATPGRSVPLHRQSPRVYTVPCCAKSDYLKVICGAPVRVSKRDVKPVRYWDSAANTWQVHVPKVQAVCSMHAHLVVSRRDT